MRFVLSWLFFFGVIVASLIVAGEAYAAGVHAALFLPLVTLGAGLFVLLVQRFVPFTERWRDYGSDLGLDLLHAVFSTGGATTLFELVAIGWIVAAADALSARFGFPLWPTELPLLAQLAVALVVAEFGTYWAHRACHVVPALWRFHALHHSSERLYAVSSGRNHPLNVVLVYVASMVPLVLLGAPGEVLLLYSVFTSVNGMIQHSNVDLRMGVLDWVFAGPALHRRHHHVEVERSNSNFGSNLILWDIVFGTREMHADERNEHVGLPDYAFQPNYLHHLASPFVLERLVRVPADAVETVVHATEQATRRATEAAAAAGRKVAEVTAEFVDAAEPRYAEASASGTYIVRRE